MIPPRKFIADVLALARAELGAFSTVEPLTGFKGQSRTISDRLLVFEVWRDGWSPEGTEPSLLIAEFVPVTEEGRPLVVDGVALHCEGWSFRFACFFYEEVFFARDDDAATLCAYL